jgi:two-component sensor histidine kinase/putative methionine-R-sulfoxide reductase with GAF domain
MPGPSGGRIEPLSSDRPTSTGGAEQTPRRKRRPRWSQGFLPIVVLIVFCAGAFWLWRLQVGNDLREGASERARVARQMGDRVTRIIDQEVRKAKGVAWRFQKGLVPDEGAFAKSVDEETVPQNAWNGAVWITREGVCEFVWPQTGEAVLKRGERISDASLWGYSLRQAHAERAPRLVRTERRSGAAQMLVLAPAISGEGTSAAYLGCVAVRIDLHRALRNAIPVGVDQDYDIDLSDGRLRLIEWGKPIERDDQAVENQAVDCLNRFLQLRVRPSEALLARQAGRSAVWVLCVGLACAVGLSWGVGYVLRRRWETGVEAQRQIAAMGSLMQTAGVISSAPGAAREALTRLAESARQLLGMAMASVTVIDEPADEVVVLAYSGAELKGGRDRYPLAQAIGTCECVATKSVILVEDVEADPRVNRVAMRDYGVRSAMFVPLTVEKKVIGCLFLGHRDVCRFTPSERRLATVLGSQAGVILANLRLYEQKDAALAEQKQITLRHDALYQIATEIYRGEDLEASLQRLSDAAPAVLGVDLCLVSLRRDADETQIVAITADYANCKGERTAVKDTNFDRIWQSRQMLVIEDGPNDSSIHPAYRHRLHIGSVIYLPLIGAGEQVIGAMTLVRHATGAFSEEQLELAGVLAARAAEAIQTAKLHEAARRSAQTQEMLLRELHHRVKNNLSSIVALLSIDRPEMPPEALAWLNRLTERIATMARTHELFVGGKDRVHLRELVAKLLPGLSVIKPAGVEFKTDLDDADVELGTERAVNLAMVLNELCWNALEHGTPENGVLQIHGHSAPGGRLTIEIEDPGRNGRPSHESFSDAANGRGFGLRMVEGLVSRELGGRFEMRTTPGGGTVARIEILPQ